MKQILLSLLFVTIICCQSFAGVKNFTPTDNIIDSAHATTNYSTNSSYTIQTDETAYIMNYDLSSISGQTATYAHLYIWTNRGGQHTDTLYRVLPNHIAAQSNWNVYSTGNNWNSAGAQTSGTDFSASNTATYTLQGGAYQMVDITAMANDCLGAGNTCNIMLRSTGTQFDVIDMAHNATNPPYLTIATGTPGVPNLWYVRDGGGNYGQTSGTCNGSANTLFNGSNGPNCAVNNPNIIVGNGNATQWAGGDIMYIDGDSDTSFDFTVSGISTRPAVGDTYTNNGHTYTVTVPTPAGLSSGHLIMSGAGLAPTASGTLTRTAGAGDSTISFSAEGASQAIYNTAGNTITLPEGVPGQQTKIIGTGSHWPQLFSNGAFLYIDATSSYIDLENLDITNHDNCIKGGPIGSSVGSSNADGYLNVCGVGGTSYPSTMGIYSGGTGLTMENLLIHNFGDGINLGYPGKNQGNVVGNITLTNVKIFGNWEQGGILGNGGLDPNITGTVSLINSQVDFNGCGQRYPLQDTTDIYNNISSVGFSHSVDNESNYYNCWGQNQFGYGDGWGYGATGSANAGNWTVIGSSISFNTQDGLDTLHGNSNGTITVIRSRLEGNAGQQIKPGGQITDIENSLINGNCMRWVGAPESSTTPGYNNQSVTCPGGDCGFNMYEGDHGLSVCRAGGDTIVFPVSAGSQTYIYGNTIASNGITLEPQGSGCNSSTGFHVYNNIIFGGGNAGFDGNLIYPGGGSTGNEQLSSYIYFDGSDGNGTGTCGPVGNGSGGVLVADEGYNLVYNTKNGNSGCSAARHDICGTTPGFNTTIPMGTPTGAIGTYYTGTQMASLEPLSSSSATRGSGLVTGLIYTNGTNDYNNFTPIALPVVDIGALQYGSVPQSCSGTGTVCTTNGGCCSGFCVSGSCAAYNCGDGIVTSPEVCDGSNLNGQTCVLQGFASGTLTCNANCLSFVTSSCIGNKAANGQACTVGSDCISGFCSSLICVDHICGDGIITSPPELCDGANLNSQTCYTQGFTAGGTLACAGNCLTFNTSGCSNQQSNVKMGFGGSIGGS